ncbi:motility associated factor glycosyltransferase family protein [Butyrivibrio sp. XBB1001]|uniref:motility associated factor glycosyltransferase family protein n=1 Tax=Butyrivibrio sp. XBB1001 TaxID=1280682 RepID=UPI000427C4AA|nr:6-hydroxymethylpterin diphosphokinase MptE-like protein [Butyrivibrio sp. XBB1001]
MAVDFLNEIYDEATMLFELKKMCEFSQRGQYRLLSDTWNCQTQIMASFCQKTATINSNLGLQIWDKISSISSCISKSNYSQVADFIEELLPQMYDAMALRGTIDVTDENYRLFSSKSGFLCLENLTTHSVSTSTTDPSFEAYKKASLLCEPSKNAFCSIGCSLGYLAQQMYEVSDQLMDIYIYELSQKRIDYAMQYGVLDKIPPHKLHIAVVANIHELAKIIIKSHLDEDKEYTTAFFIDSELLEPLEKENAILANAILEKNTTSLNFLNVVERNFYCNYSSVKKFVSDIEIAKPSEHWIVVGGGPSLNYSIDYIKEKASTATIIAATTVIRKLIDTGIIPDFMIAIDMQARTFRHLEGLNDLDVPLILSDCASWKFGKLYKGEKYLIPTSGMYFSKEIYKRQNVSCHDISGTVSAVAINIAALKGATTVDLVGLDLSYPGGQTHASGTMDNSTIDTSNLINVPSVNGQEVATTPVFMSYIRDVEKIIAKNPNIKFINKSRDGAYIKGCAK